MKNRGIVSVIFFAMALFSLPAVEAAIRLKQDALSRDFGYVIGDLVTRTIMLEIEHPHTLQRSDIPKPGRINRWLELVKNDLQVDRKRNFSRYRLELQYQIFNSEPGRAEVFLPGFDLSLTTSERMLPLVFHDLPIKVLSITSDDPSRSLEFLDLQPPVSPQPVSELSGWVELGLAVTGLVLSLMLITYVYAVLPWSVKRAGPFARAVKKLRRLRQTTGTRENYRDVLKTIHEAFNQSYGKVLLFEDLEEFFRQQPSFRKMRRELTELFAHSRAFFFAGSEKRSRWPLTRLIKICRQCRDIERGLS